MHSAVVSTLMCVFWCMYVHISIGYTQKWNCLERMRMRQLPEKDEGKLSQPRKDLCTAT